MIQTQSVRNALVYYDDRFNARWLKAIGQNVTEWELGVGLAQDDSSADPTTMTNTEGGTNSAVSSTTTGDRLLITTGGTEYNGVNLQVKGSAFKIQANKPVYYGIEAKTDNATKGDFLFGLCEVDTTLLATASAHALAVTDDGLYFYKLNDGTAFIFVNELGGTEGATATGVTNDTNYHIYEFYWDGSTLYVYVDNSLVTSITSGLADQALTPSFNVRAGDDGAEVLYVKWARAIMIE